VRAGLRLGDLVLAAMGCRGYFRSAERARMLAENSASLYFLATTRNSNEPGSTVGQGFGGTGGPSLPDGK